MKINVKELDHYIFSSEINRELGFYHILRNQRCYDLTFDYQIDLLHVNDLVGLRRIDKDHNAYMLDFTLKMI